MLTLNDGRSELWQWDTGRTLAVDADCSQVHFSNRVFGQSIDVDVVDGAAIIPDILLQTDKALNVWAFVGTAENGYTKISKTFKVNRRNKPADYVFTPPDQTTLAELVERLDKIEESQDPDAIKNAVEDYLQQNPVEAPVQSVNGKTGAVELTAEDVGAIADETDPTVPEWAKAATKPSYTADEVGALSAATLPEAITTALAQAKESGEFDGADGQDGITPTIGENGNWYLGETDTGKPSRGETGPAGADGRDGADGQPGENGTDGYSPTANVTQTDSGATITITDKNGTTTATVTNGKDGADGIPGKDGANGADGKDGITPTIGENGNWYLGDTDTGTPSRGETGQAGADGKSAYQYAVEGGFTGTEAEFASKLAEEMPDKLPNPNALTFSGAVTGRYDGSAPLTVNIPAGGGGGGSSDKWELINTITVSNDATTNVTFTQDSAGNPFALKKFYLKISGISGSSTYPAIRLNGLHWTEQFGGIVIGKAANMTISVLFELLGNGIYIWEWANPHGRDIRRTGERTPQGGTQSLIETINSVMWLWGTNSAITNGSVFTLYGVRA